jgi:hypothetical protein
MSVLLCVLVILWQISDTEMELYDGIVFFQRVFWGCDGSGDAVTRYVSLYIFNQLLPCMGPCMGRLLRICNRFLYALFNYTCLWLCFFVHGVQTGKIKPKSDML